LHPFGLCPAYRGQAGNSAPQYLLLPVVPACSGAARLIFGILPDYASKR
jgi:hypothetical protein